MCVFAAAFLFGYFIFIWLKTDAFAEYINLFKLNNFPKIDEYNQLHNNGFDGNYIDFLNQYYRNLFIVRLLVCPVCISFWIGIISIVFTLNFYSFITAPLSLLFYLLFNKML